MRELMILLGSTWVLCALFRRSATTALAPASGLTLDGEKVQMLSWDRWMSVAPQLIKNSIDEGESSPEEIVNNLMRRVFPQHRWPPQKSAKHFGVWMHMVQTVASTLDRPHTPQLKVVSSDGR